MWLFSGASDDPENDTVKEQHGADALYSAEKSLMHAIRTKDKQAEQDVAQRKVQIARPWTKTRRSELKLANKKPLLWMMKENANLIDLEWTED